MHKAVLNATIQEEKDQRERANMLAGCVRFTLVAGLPEFNKLLLPVANTNIVPLLAGVVDVQIMLTIPVGNYSKAWEDERHEGRNQCVSQELHPERELLEETEDMMCQQWVDVTDQWLMSYRSLDAVMA